MLYSKSRRRELTKTMPGVHQSEISKILGIEWASLAPSQRASFFHESAHLRHSCDGTSLTSQKKKRRRPTLHPMSEGDQAQYRLGVPNTISPCTSDSTCYPGFDFEILNVCELPLPDEHRSSGSSPRNVLGEMSRCAFEEFDSLNAWHISVLAAQSSVDDADALENLPLGWNESVPSRLYRSQDGTSAASMSATSMMRSPSPSSSESEPGTLVSSESRVLVPLNRNVLSDAVLPLTPGILGNPRHRVLCQQNEETASLSSNDESFLPDAVYSHLHACSVSPSSRISGRPAAHGVVHQLQFSTRDLKSQMTSKRKRDAETQTAEPFILDLAQLPIALDCLLHDQKQPNVWLPGALFALSRHCYLAQDGNCYLKPISRFL
mmetsp:Transcript_4852/g.8316  ORF Transcript_4852/g.8316 Transcript_4852/m.8316 type:complete len:378 (-) Transcript_4852:457-1590(-)